MAHGVVVALEFLALSGRVQVLVGQPINNEGIRMSYAELAKEIACTHHSGQVRTMGRDKGKPYIIHPERIANRVMGDELEAVAWLHDVIEDTSLTIPDLKAKGFPMSILGPVHRLTKSPGMSYLSYLQRVKRDPIARVVKIEDIRDNLVSCPRGNMRDKYELALYFLQQGK